jgi:O-antigen/teichoic acid export membrane protein
LITAYPAFVLAFLGVKSVSVTTHYMSSFAAAGRHEDFKAICKLGFSMDLVVAALNLALVAATSVWVARYFLALEGSAWMMNVIAFSSVVASLGGTSRAILVSRQRFRHLAGLYFAAEVITFLCVIGLLLGGFGAPGVIVAKAAGEALTGVVMLAVANRVLSREGIGPWWRAPIASVAALRGELASFFGWNYIAVTLNGVVAQVPLMLLGRLRGPYEAGFFRIGMNFLTVASYLETSLGQVVYPMLSARCGNGEHAGIGKTLRQWTLQAGLPTAAAVLAGIFLMPYFVPLLFGETYQPMIFGLQTMLAGAVIGTLFFWLSSFFYASGNVGRWTKAYGVYAALTVILAWWFIQQWGFVGLALVTAAAKIVFTVAMAASLPTPRAQKISPRLC